MATSLTFFLLLLTYSKQFRPPKLQIKLRRIPVLRQKRRTHQQQQQRFNFSLHFADDTLLYDVYHIISYIIWW